MEDKEFVLVFKALADETRLKIVQMLLNGEHCACAILENFSITQPTLSYHMKLLCDSKLVCARRDGAWMRYTLNMDTVNSIKELFNDISLSDCSKKTDCNC